MKQLTIILTAFFLITSSIGLNAQGVDFEHGTVEDVLKLAKEDDKLVFVDCLTDWCGPCKWMSANTFTDPEVGEFFNENFINFKLDMEKGEGIEFAKKYNVRAYPTLVFLDGNGELVHIGIGARDPEGFIELGRIALDPEWNLKGLKTRYHNGDRNAEFLGTYLKLQNSSGMDISKVMTDWQLVVKPEDLTKESNWSVFDAVFTDSDNEYFSHVVDKYDVFSSTLGEEVVNGKILNIYRQDLLKALTDDDDSQVSEVKSTIQNSGIEGAEKMLLVTEMSVAARAKEWNKYKSLAETVVEGYSEGDWQLLNSIAWSYYEQFDDKKDLKKALNWASKAVDIEANYYNLDTFGMLLVKLGEKEDAIKQLEMAIKKAHEDGLDATVTEKALKEIQ